MHEDVWKALADSTRREILDILSLEPRTTGQLCDGLSRLDRCTVMKHLDVLVKAGLVVSAKHGRVRMNHINAMPLHEIVERWVSGHTARMALAARGFKALAEDENEL